MPMGALAVALLCGILAAVAAVAAGWPWWAAVLAYSLAGSAAFVPAATLPFAIQKLRQEGTTGLLRRAAALLPAGRPQPVRIRFDDR